MKYYSLLLSALLLASCQPALKFNEIQFIGSHNSYKQAIDPELHKLLEADDPQLSLALDYSHIPIRDQLNLGLRNLELDVVLDPEGGRYADPLGLKMTGAAAPYDDEAMRVPGFKVMHVPDIDFRSNCQLLAECLRSIKSWSEQHPRHLPIVITLNAKDEIIDRPGFTRPLQFDSQSWELLDAEILTVIGSSLFTPDDLRGAKDTLPNAIKHGWPPLKQLRGRMLFVLDHDGEKLQSYVLGHKALKGRVMFVNAKQGAAESAIHIVNDPVGSFDRIQMLVQAGYIVRTRADADTVEARTGETQRRDNAFASGAQIITTDYYREDERLGSGYKVALPQGAVAVCNPVIANQECLIFE